eukprot:s1529_g11.t1
MLTRETFASCPTLSRPSNPEERSRRDPEPHSQGERVFKNMVDVYDGILKEDAKLVAEDTSLTDVEQFFKDTTVNRTMRRRFTGKGGEQVQSAYKLVFDREAQLRPPPSGADDTNMEDHEKYMKLAMAVAARGAKAGLAKDRTRPT